MFTCTTCKVVFDDFSAQRVHYQSDWHRYNLKRKTVNLDSLPEEEYLLRRRQAEASASLTLKQQTAQFFAKCLTCKKTFTTQAGLTQHQQSKKHQLSLVHQEEQIEVSVSEQEVGEKKKLDTTLKAHMEGGHPFPEEQPDEDTITEAEMQAQEAQARRDLGSSLDPEHCIFCPKAFTSLDECLDHMLATHGFFIPEREECQQLSQLVRYCQEKVKLGKLCLYCDKSNFQSFSDVQNHMTFKSHCKLSSDEDAFEIEFGEYYVQLDPVGEEEEEWLTDDEEEDDDSDSEECLTVSETGELVLLDGRRVGTRQMHRYYKQRLPDDVSEYDVCRRLLHCDDTSASVRSAALARKSTGHHHQLSLKTQLHSKKRNQLNGRTMSHMRSVNYQQQKHRERLDKRSHKLIQNTNRKLLVTV